MDYFIYFVVFALPGCFLQCIAFILGLYALTGKKYDGVKFWAVSALYTIILILLRCLCNFNLINFGIHTIIMMGCAILIGLFVLKSNIFRVSLSAIVVFVIITISEIITNVLLSIIMGKDNLSQILSADKTAVKDQTLKVLLGIPSNLLIFMTTLLLYIILVKAKMQCKNINSNNID